MKVLYAALRHDPRNPVLSSGADYGFYTAIQKVVDQVDIVGPYGGDPPLPERLLQRLYRRLSGKKYIKWNFHTIWQCSTDLNKAVKQHQPDVVFSIFPAAFALYDNQAPAVFATDLAFEAWQRNDAGFGNLAIRFLKWLEGQAVKKCSRVITYTEWAKQELVKSHGVSPDKIVVMPLPAAIPLESVPPQLEIRCKELTQPLRLLLVGRTYHRKGIDIAIDVVNRLNQNGIPAQLTISGMEGTDEPHVHFAGHFNKDNPDQLRQYLDLYDHAHLMLQPSRFEPAGTFASEAAAFGTPTITNNTGGMSTTVRDGYSGLVLPEASPADAYVQAITNLIGDPQRYYALCQTTRMHYDDVVNWEAATRHLAVILQEAVQAHRR